MIKISTRGEYGARMMVELGRHYGQGPVSLADIATEAGLPLDYLEHLMIPLRKAGLVRSRRGAKGGYALAKHPREIVMGQVVRLLEGPIAPMICATECDRTPDQLCEREDFCTTRILWMRVRDSVASALDSTTLEDLLPPTPPVGRAERVTNDAHQKTPPDKRLNVLRFPQATSLRTIAVGN